MSQYNIKLCSYKIDCSSGNLVRGERENRWRQQNIRDSVCIRQTIYAGSDRIYWRNLESQVRRLPSDSSQFEPVTSESQSKSPQEILTVSTETDERMVDAMRLE